MSDATPFLRKRRDPTRNGRPRVPSAAPPRPPISKSTSSSSTRNANGGPIPSTSASSSSSQVKAEPSAPISGANITEIKIYSSAPGSATGLRYNLMRLNTARDVDPSQISQPILMNRKKLGDRAPPIFAIDEEGKILGRYVYDNSGKPVLDANGEQVYEKQTKSEIDTSLIGIAPGQDTRRKTRKGTKEVYHQDIEVMRLRREELDPWILESKLSQENRDERLNNNPAAIPEHWVGRMQEASSLPTVLLINDGTTDGFEMVPLGRTYRFDPERPFKTLDSDSANKLFEHQAKHKIHDRWALRPEGQTSAGVGDPTSGSSVKVERELEQRAMRLEGRIRLSKGLTIDRKPKIERYEDDYRREGRQAERGLEGGVDEELDFDEADEFQDDDDNNTFYRDAQEEEAAKEIEEKLRQEFRMANANVGDRPQISKADGEDDDDFGKKKLDEEGKKLRKMFRKRREANPDDFDLFDDDDSDYDSDSTDTADEDAKKDDAKDKEKEKGSDNEREKSLPPDQQRSRPSSRGPGSRGTSSPTGRRPNAPSSGKASTAPPGSGAALLAQRAASRGASPRPPSGLRAGSPLSGRAASPDGLRAASPIRGTSPVNPSSRGTSPVPPGVRGSSPASGQPSRDVSPAPGSQARPQTGKRKTTSQSPVNDNSAGPSPSGSGKRKSSPTGSVSSTIGNTTASGSGPKTKKAKKSSSLTPTPGPEETPSFQGQITKEDVLSYFRSKPDGRSSMADAISAFRQRILQAGTNRENNQKLFLLWTKTIADQDQKMLRLKEEYR